TRSKRDWSSDVCSSDLLLSSGSERIADSSMRRPSSVVFLRAPSQLSMTMRLLCEECFIFRTLLRILSACETRKSLTPSGTLPFAVLPDIESTTSFNQGKCFRSLGGETRLEM